MRKEDLLVEIKQLREQIIAVHDTIQRTSLRLVEHPKEHEHTLMEAIQRKKVQFSLVFLKLFSTSSYRILIFKCL